MLLNSAATLSKLDQIFKRRPSSVRGSTLPTTRSVDVEQTLPSVENGRNNEPDPELKLPKMSSLAIVIMLNVMSQITMFIPVSSASKYAEFLGGTATFSGLVLGIPVVFAGIALPPLLRYDQGKYSRPIHFSCAVAIIGHILYGLAYYANFLWLILIGRSVIGLAMANFMYSKRYCSDARIVGIRRRTTLAGWLVLGQGIGCSVGPFLGGLLFKVGFGNRVFNGDTAPGWLMAALWAVYWVAVWLFFDDVPDAPSRREESAVEDEKKPYPSQTSVTLAEADESAPSTAAASTVTVSPSSSTSTLDESERITLRQWGVIATMCWFAMTCFFVLSGWESNIAVFTAAQFNWSPFAAGNFIALGGISIFPFLFLNLYLVRRVPDRFILAFGASTGFLGLLLTLLIIHFNKATFGSFFVCWFLVALGFNVASTVTMSLLSKQMHPKWNGRMSLAIQYSNFTGRVSGSVWGGAGVQVGMEAYVGLQMALLGVGVILFLTLWRNMKAKTG
ncbi:MFS general substrate transporter [Fomitiporia mediterranea MF3/22]|uniref:MFS general substrate transporter n=1 Tax=Fomitiporia mediterranea (strain MF3/22) TaxID=694068 RepID=UPI0004407FA8|nr:MFS general substrate transporter [Fomitiporia mediterranea MF3/22]EJC99575.1 MFS general substrate transporter [Fomitiporia mediterranea MF3/22]